MDEQGFDGFTKVQSLEKIFSEMGFEKGDFYKILFWDNGFLPACYFPTILLGGWLDDEICEDSHHIQRILIKNQPPANIERLFVFSSAYFGKSQPLDLVHYSVVVEKKPGIIDNIIAQKRKNFLVNEWLLEYPCNKEEITVMPGVSGENKVRVEKFDLFGAVWLSDGRIFVNENNLRFIPAMMQLSALLIMHKLNSTSSRWLSLRECLFYQQELCEKIKSVQDFLRVINS